MNSRNNFKRHAFTSPEINSYSDDKNDRSGSNVRKINTEDDDYGKLICSKSVENPIIKQSDITLANLRAKIAQHQANANNQATSLLSLQNKELQNKLKRIPIHQKNAANNLSFSPDSADVLAAQIQQKHIKQMAQRLREQELRRKIDERLEYANK